MDLRKLDSLVAEHVFGWTDIRNRIDGCGMSGQAPEDNYTKSVPSYSTDIALAVGMLEKLNAQGWTWRIDHQPNMEHSIAIYRRGGKRTGWMYATQLPLAICHATMKVLGVPP